MGLLAKLSESLGGVKASAYERRKEANEEYALQLLQSERDLWYARLRSQIREEQDAARRELDHLDRLEREHMPERARG